MLQADKITKSEFIFNSIISDAVNRPSFDFVIFFGKLKTIEGSDRPSISPTTKACDAKLTTLYLLKSIEFIVFSLNSSLKYNFELSSNFVEIFLIQLQSPEVQETSLNI